MKPTAAAANHTTSATVIPARDARLLLLGAQGLLDDPYRAATAPSLHKLITQMGFVQLDTINVIERAHHLTLFSRMHRYQKPLLTTLLEKRRSLFEHWTHDASAIPIEFFAHWRHRFQRYKSRTQRSAWWHSRLGEDPQALIDDVRTRIERDGPLLSKDFERASDAPKPAEDGWWGWKPQKAALEHLWRSGDLSVLRRVNFQKVYDLTHRVFPGHHALDVPDDDALVDWACRSALERLGIATPTELAGFWNAIDIAQARRWCEAGAKAGKIEPVIVEAEPGSKSAATAKSESKPKPSFAVPDWRKRLRELSDPPQMMRTLSPFDPVIRDRKRAQRLFNFDYTFEAFTPGPKRVYGYYVLPVLRGDRLVARIDPKLHRDRGVLEIKGVWWEKSAKPAKADRAELREAIERLAGFVGAREIE